MKILLIVLTASSFLLLGVSCDSIQPTKKDRTGSPEDILNGEDGSENERTAGSSDQQGYVEDPTAKFFRTGTSYLYALAKAAKVPGSVLKQNYDSAKFYKETTASETSLGILAKTLPAYSQLASDACEAFFGLDENRDVPREDLVRDFASRIFVDSAEGDAFVEQSLASASAAGLEGNDMYQFSCMEAGTSAMTY